MCNLLDEINDTKNRKILNCGHIFHKECIDSWTKLNFHVPFIIVESI